MVPIHLHGPLNGTNSLEGCRLFRSSGLHVHGAYSLFSVNDRQRVLMNGTVYLMESQFLRRRLFVICSHFFGANSLANNVSKKKKQYVFCLQTQNPIRTPAPACRACGHPGGHIFTEFSLADDQLRVSQTKIIDNWVRGGRHQLSPDCGKQNRRAVRGQ